MASYSIRVRKRVSVSMLIGWDELDFMSPDDIDHAISRMSMQDPWEGFFKNDQMLK